MNGADDGHLIGLTILLQLSRRVRDAASLGEIGFIAVNESKQLIEYRQSALWLKERGVVSVSGLPEPDQSSPYIQWLSTLFKQCRPEAGCYRMNSADLPALLANSWDEWFPPHAVIVPLRSKKDTLIGLLLFVRDAEWDDHDLALLAELGSIYGHALTLHSRGRGGVQRIATLIASAWFRIFLLLVLIGCLFLPVRMSTQAPAEVVPKDPFVVRSPLDSVIDRFHVRPNQPVKQGQLLFEFDRTNLRAKHGVASKAFQVAAEEYRQASQSALVDDRSRADITPRRGKMEEKATELSYSRQLLQRVEVRAPRAGIAVFAEQGDWVGKNVSIGERILTIADPERVEMLIRLPVADAIQLNPGGAVRMYLASDPQHPLDGVIRYAAYKPEATPAGIVAYRIKADFTNSNALPRIGLTGTARIYGADVTLGYYIFRRPLTALQQRLGW